MFNRMRWRASRPINFLNLCCYYSCCNSFSTSVSAFTPYTFPRIIEKPALRRFASQQRFLRNKVQGLAAMAPQRRRTRSSTSAVSSSHENEEAAKQVSEQQVEEKPVPRKSPAKRRKTAPSDTSNNDKGTSSPETTKKANRKGKKNTPSETSTSAGNTSNSEKASPAVKKKRPPAHQVITERDEIARLWDPKANEPSSTMKIASWNVAGLRALMNKLPNALSDLVTKHDIDILCLQETKLQESHLDDPKLKIRGHLLQDEGYDAYYSCSTARKGYSGTAIFVKQRTGVKKQQQSSLDDFFSKKKDTPKAKEGKQGDAADFTPTKVSYAMKVEKHDSEGRLIVLEFPRFTLCNVYVPNSGQELKRLDYRTTEWDKDFLEFMQNMQKDRGLPVIWTGDLNVAHTHLDVWNDGAKHLLTQAGTTPQERASFEEQLNAGFVDAFRKLHPDAKGHYSYWSVRAGNRSPNKGLRLDYFICDPSLFDSDSPLRVRDSYMIYDQEGSDHCPIVMEVEVKK